MKAFARPIRFPAYLVEKDNTKTTIRFFLFWDLWALTFSALKATHARVAGILFISLGGAGELLWIVACKLQAALTSASRISVKRRLWATANDF
jgi:hypothetical protein